MGYRKRLVAPGVPHHVTQRGTRRGNVFFSDKDREFYLDLLMASTEKYNVTVLSYCLMTNHVHLMLVPSEESSLSLAMRSVHKKYADKINQEMGWKGHLWQERFFSSPVDSKYFWIAVRYIERNSVEAGIVEHAADYQWSSAAAHCGLKKDPVLNYSEDWAKQFSLNKDWYKCLSDSSDLVQVAKLLRNIKRDLPTGSDIFLTELEKKHGIPTRLKKRGRRMKIPTR